MTTQILEEKTGIYCIFTYYLFTQTIKQNKESICSFIRAISIIER